MNIRAWARLRSLMQPAPRPNTPPGAALSPSAIQRGLRLSILEGAISNIHISITTSAFVTGFALLLGASDFELGVIGALPFIGQLFQFVSAYIEEQIGERRLLAALAAGIGRMLWAIIAALPFLMMLGGARLYIFLITMAVSQVLLNIAGNAWTSWMSELVPPRQRGSYFGIRNTITSITAMFSTWLAGYLLDYFRATGNEPLGYTVIFGFAVLTSILGIMVLLYQPEPPPTRARQRLAIASLLIAPLKHQRFRALILTATGWAFVTGIASPFFNAYGLQALNLSFAMLAFFGVLASAVMLVTQPFIGKLQDRYGDRAVLIVSVIGVVGLPWGWILSTPTFLIPLWTTQILSGIFWPGITQGLVNLTMDRAPAEGRGAYVACYGACTGIGTFVASLLGGVIATSIGTAVWHVGFVRLDHYAVLLVMSSVGRAMMALFFARRL